MSALFALFCAAAVTTSPDVVLLDFRSDSCGPCRAMDPIVHEMKDAGIPIRVVNVDREPSLAKQYRVGPIPCFIVLANGEEVSRQTGKCSRGELENMLRLGQAALGGAKTEARERAPTKGTPLQLVKDESNSKPRLNGAPRGQANLAQSLELEAPRTQKPSTEKPNTEKPRLVKPGVREVQERTPLPDEGAQPSKLAGPVNEQPIPAALRDELLQSSVRLILHDDRGRATGSGTVIDCREGEALILTCGHIFREWSERGRVSVDFFDGAAERAVPARVVKYNLKSDVALLAITTRRQLRVAHVASPRVRTQKGEAVLAAGCEHGADVAPFPTKITQIDKYLGPPNLCIAGQPKQGRSGGGLFNSQGQVIGVCNAADQQDNEGLYASLGAIHQLLDEAKLEFIYREDAPTPSFAREFERQLTHEPPTMPNQMPTDNREDRLRSEAAIATMDRQPKPLQFPPNSAGTGSFAANTALNANVGSNGQVTNAPKNQLTANSAKANEVILIFQDEKTANPQGRVVHLRNVSPDLMARLAEEEKQQTARAPQPTIPPNGLTPTANPSGAGANLLPNPGGLRRDVTAPPVSFNR
jgi:S1-C subfamily serine protease